MTSLLILNCNNTLRQSISNPGSYINSPKDQEIIPGAIKALKKLSVGWVVVGVHNDGGLSTYNPATQKMWKNLPDSIAEQRYTIKLLASIKPIKAIYLCPDAKGTGTSCLKVTSTRNTKFNGDGYRLPLPGMLDLAIKAYAPRSNEIVYVGDEEKDSVAANSLNIKFLWAEDWWQ